MTPHEIKALKPGSQILWLSEDLQIRPVIYLGPSDEEDIEKFEVCGPLPQKRVEIYHHDGERIAHSKKELLIVKQDFLKNDLKMLQEHLKNVERELDEIELQKLDEQFAAESASSSDQEEESITI